MIPHSRLETGFRVSLSESCAYLQRDPVTLGDRYMWSGKNALHGLQRVRSFSSAERLAINSGCPSLFLGFRYIDLVASSRMFGRCRERTATVVLRRKTCCNCSHATVANFRTSNLRDPCNESHRAMPTGGPKIDSGETAFPSK